MHSTGAQASRGQCMIGCKGAGVSRGQHSRRDGVGERVCGDQRAWVESWVEADDE
jgi:hypothetical protein